MAGNRPGVTIFTFTAPTLCPQQVSQFCLLFPSLKQNEISEKPHRHSHDDPAYLRDDDDRATSLVAPPSLPLEPRHLRECRDQHADRKEDGWALPLKRPFEKIRK